MPIFEKVLNKKEAYPVATLDKLRGFATTTVLSSVFSIFNNVVCNQLT
jgi:hypothetical protein